MSVNVFPVGATCWSTPKIVPWTPDAIHILLLLAVTEVVPPYYQAHTNQKNYPIQQRYQKYLQFVVANQDTS